VNRHFTDPLALTCIALWLLICLAAVFADVITRCDYRAQDLTLRLQPPSRGHPFGCDHLGRDILSRVIHGARTSLSISVLVVLIAMSVGTCIGLLSGTAGMVVDTLIMRTCDIFLAFPGILLAIAMAAIMPQTRYSIIIALSTISWVGFARLTRGQVLSVKEQEYILAARSLGAGYWRVTVRHILPNCLSPLIVQATMSLASVILAESSLAFLGLGVGPPYPSWGGMLSSALDYMLDAPHMVLFPGLAIVATVLTINLLGDRLRDFFDPRFKPIPRAGGLLK